MVTGLGKIPPRVSKAFAVPKYVDQVFLFVWCFLGMVRDSQKRVYSSLFCCLLNKNVTSISLGKIGKSQSHFESSEGHNAEFSAKSFGAQLFASQSSLCENSHNRVRFVVPRTNCDHEKNDL